MDRHELIWFSVEDAVPLLKKSASTIRRQIERGKLVGEKHPRPQGAGFTYTVGLTAEEVSVLRQQLSDASPAPPSPKNEASNPENDASNESAAVVQTGRSGDHPDVLAAQRAASALDEGQLVLLRQLVVDPLMEHLDEATQQLQARSEIIANQREEIGRLGATNQHLLAQVGELHGRLALAEEKSDLSATLIWALEIARVESEAQKTQLAALTQPAAPKTRLVDRLFAWIWRA